MRAGYTLIELLVVISIMAVLGMIAAITFRNLAEDQMLNRSLGQVQTVLRLAQANATSGTLCGNLGGVKWSVFFNTDNPSQGKIDLYCGNTVFIRSFPLENVRISSIKSSACLSVSYPGSLVLVNFSPISGKIDFLRQDCQADFCKNNCINGTELISNPILTISLQNIRSSSIRNLNLSKGGSIDVN